MEEGSNVEPVLMEHCNVVALAVNNVAAAQAFRLVQMFFVPVGLAARFAFEQVVVSVAGQADYIALVEGSALAESIVGCFAFEAQPQVGYLPVFCFEGFDH